MSSILTEDIETIFLNTKKIAKSLKNNTILITGAAGGVGSIAGQIFKIAGCKVIGIAGGKEKCDILIDEFGFDGAIDYRSDDLNDSIKKLCPGIIYTSCSLSF